MIDSVSKTISESFSINKELFISASKEVIESGEIILGRFVKDFENSFSAYIGSDYAVGVANGTDAIELAIAAISDGRKLRVGMQANAGGYGTIALSCYSHEIIYIDVSVSDAQIDIDFLRLCVKQLDVLIVTHLYGQVSARFGEIVELCNQNSVLLVEDCSQCHGAVFESNKAGSFGVVSTFSFYPTKNLGCYGDGGIILTSDFGIYEKLIELRTYGWNINNKYEKKLFYGRNSRLDAVHANFLKYALAYLDQNNLKRRSVSNFYKNNIKLNCVEFFNFSSDMSYVGHLYILKSIYREKIIKYLNDKDIPSSVYYPYADYNQVYNNKGHLLRNTRILCENNFSLPINPFMNLRQLTYIVESLNSFKL